MKQNRPFTLRLPQPCSENWEEMTPSEKGRFCLNCQKTVIDFSGLSDKQVIEIINNTKVPMCGRFHPQQLNKEFAVADSRPKPFIPVAAIISALYFFLPSARAQRIPLNVPVSAGEKDTGTVPVKQQVDTPKTVSKAATFGTISGVVLSGKEKEPLPGATVMILPVSERVGAATDETGKFRLTVPYSYTKDTLLVRVSYVGFESQEFCLPLLEGNRHLEIYMHESYNELMGDIIIVRKPSVWKRLNPIRHLFR